MTYPALEYLTKSKTSAFFPKLLGTYEKELTTAIEELVIANPDVIVNIGAGEGYYAIGMALRCPAARVVAFEADPAAHPVLADMAARNGIHGKVEVRGRCEPVDLSAALVGATRPVVICDVEGYENVLLNHAAVPALAITRVLVETHEKVVPGITTLLENRFATTHIVSRIREEVRTTTDYPFHTWATRLLPKYYVTFMVREHRFERMNWLWMVPRQAAKDGG